MTIDEKILFLKELIDNTGKCYSDTRAKHKIQTLLTCEGCPIKQDVPIQCDSISALKASKKFLEKIPQDKLFEVLL